MADIRPEMADIMPEMADIRPERMDERTNRRKNESPPVFYRTLSVSGPLPKKAQKKAHSLSPEKKSQQCHVVTVTSDSPTLRSVKASIQLLINFDRIPTRSD